MVNSLSPLAASRTARSCTSTAPLPSPLSRIASMRSSASTSHFGGKGLWMVMRRSPSTTIAKLMEDFCGIRWRSGGASPREITLAKVGTTFSPLFS